MTIDEITDLVLEMAALRYFPAEPAARVAIVRAIGAMTHNDAEIRWLIRRMTSGIYAEWPGLQEMRACFCCRYKPKDGINAYSTVYIEGLPPDPTVPLRIESVPLKQLASGEPQTVDPVLNLSVQFASKLVGMGGKATPAEIMAAPDWLRKLEGYE